MADDQAVIEKVDGDQEAAPEAGKTTTQVADKAALLSGGADTEAPDTTAEPDWRDKVAKAAGVGEDAKYRAWLNRFTSEENYHKAIPRLRRDFSAARAPELPEDATPEEVAAHRKALGIPEKPDGYGIAYPEGITPSEGAKEILSAFQQRMLDRNVTPAAAKAAFEFYLETARSNQEAQFAVAQEATDGEIDALKTEWGRRDYAKNLKLAEEFLFAEGAFSRLLPEPFFDPETAEEMVRSFRSPSGVALKDHAPFVRAMAKLARAFADEETLVAGDGAGGGKSLEEEKKELVTKSVTQGLSKTEDARLNQIFEALTAREERQGRRSAA
jgi:hypothetical protein